MAADPPALPRGRLRRAGRIGSTFGRVYLGMRAQRWLDTRDRGNDAESRWSRFHTSSAESIYQAATELGGLLLKGCQILGSRADLIPAEYVEVLSRLQDRVPPSPFPEVRRIVERELGGELGEIFESFAQRPVASASLAQVHEARLHSGERVAVKVQYPQIERLVQGDLSNLRLLLRGIGLLERDLHLEPIIGEVASSVRQELNFLAEARNAERVADFFADRDDVAVPRVHWELTARRVLVMEFVEGVKIDDRLGLRSAGVDPEAVLQTLSEAYCEQILGRGFFHADPHPGNLMVRPGPQGRYEVVFLDFGLSKELPRGFRRATSHFVLALLQRDTEAMARGLLELGFETRDGKPEGLHRIAEFVLTLAGEFQGGARGQGSMLEDLRRRLPEEIRRNPVIRVPTDLVLLARVLVLLAGLNRSLDVRPSLAPSILRYVTPESPELYDEDELEG